MRFTIDFEPQVLTIAMIKVSGTRNEHVAAIHLAVIQGSYCCT